jgi:hypothetical protein
MLIAVMDDEDTNANDHAGFLPAIFAIGQAVKGAIPYRNFG